MNATTIARQNAVEAIKSSYRQTKDGVSVTFVIHPQEMPDALALAPLGSRWMVALVPIGDDETPQNAEQAAQSGRPDTSPAPIAPRSPGVAGKPDGAGPALKPRRPWRDLPVAQRAALICSDPNGWTVLANVAASAVVPSTDAEAAHLLRRYCVVFSRADIADNERALSKYLRFETEYMRATGRIAAP